MKFQNSLFPQSLPTLIILNTLTASAENTEPSLLTPSLSWNTQQIPPPLPTAALLRAACPSSALTQNACPLLRALWQGSGFVLFCFFPFSFFHRFWGQILHSTAVFVYRTRTECRTHTLDPAVFLRPSPPPDSTIETWPCRPVVIGHWWEPRGWPEKVPR